MAHVDFACTDLLYDRIFVALLYDRAGTLVRRDFERVNQVGGRIQADVLVLLGAYTDGRRNLIRTCNRVELARFDLIRLELRSLFLIAHLMVDHDSGALLAYLRADTCRGLVAANS